VDTSTGRVSFASTRSIQVENLNRQWSWWFPRGTNLKDVQPAEADHVASIINGQRRRSLGYQSPTALYAAATVQ
jgi:IS30 family transposase